MAEPEAAPARQLPHNEQAEAALIARLLADPAQVPVLAGSMPAEDFYVGLYRTAYAAMQKLASSRKAIDVMTLQDATGDKNADLSRALSQIEGYRAPIAEYVDIIRRDAFRRRLIGGMIDMENRAYVEEDKGRLVSELHDTVVRISSGIGADSLMSPVQAAEAYEVDLEARRDGTHKGLTYGFQSMDAILNPAGAGEMIVVAARPSVGKTALAETISDHWATTASFPVLFVSLEMGITQLMDRTVSRHSQIEAKRLVRGQLTEEEYERAYDAASERKLARMWYLDDPFATTASVRAAAAKTKMIAGGLSAIVVDYLQLLKDPGEQEVQRVTKISRQIKAIAREFEVPLLVLSQLSRAVMQREDQHPQLHDLRESGAIEQDADVVIGLYRPPNEPIMGIEVLKQRQGELGTCHLEFDGAHMTFEEVQPHPVGTNLLETLAQQKSNTSRQTAEERDLVLDSSW